MPVRYYRMVIPSLTGSPGAHQHKKTPEMNELGSNKKILKISAPNFEKQKSLSIFRFTFFLASRSSFRSKKPNMVADNRELSSSYHRNAAWWLLPRANEWFRRYTEISPTRDPVEDLSSWQHLNYTVLHSNN